MLHSSCLTTPPPNPTQHSHSSNPTQAKAGLADAAFATYRRMRRAGAAPNPWTFSMLLSACGRARQPERAAEVLDRLMPQVAWAALPPLCFSMLLHLLHCVLRFTKVRLGVLQIPTLRR